MKTTKTELKKWFERNKGIEITFTFEVDETFTDIETNEIVLNTTINHYEEKRQVTSVTPSYIRFDKSNLEISKHMQVETIEEDKLIVSYPTTYTTIGEVRYNGKDYKGMYKQSKKYLKYTI